MARWVGLDVHKRVVEACFVDDQGNVLKRVRFALTHESLTAFATRTLQPTDHVVLEATTNTWAVVDLLTPHVAEVVVSNPTKTKVIAEANVKTDKVDAHVLAQLLRTGFVPRVWQPDAHTRMLRKLASRRAGLVADRTVIKNRIHAVLAQRLIVAPMASLFSRTGVTWLEGLALDEDGRREIDSDLGLLRALEREIDKLDAEAAKVAYRDERIRLLMTLPGVDVAVALTVVATLGDITRFKDGDHAASYIGLVPGVKQSAEHCYYKPITKAGNGTARCMLVEAAQHLGDNPGPLGAFYRKLRRKKSHSVAAVAVARKLVVVAWHMLTHAEPYRYALPAATETKLRRLRVRATGQRSPRGHKPGQGLNKPLVEGMRTKRVKPLADVYDNERLPTLHPPTEGEKRSIRLTGTAQFVGSIQKTQLVSRPKRPRP